MPRRKAVTPHPEADLRLPLARTLIMILREAPYGAAEIPLELLISCVRMPKMDDIELARLVMGPQPQASVIYISSYPFNVEQEERTNPTWAFRGRHV